MIAPDPIPTQTPPLNLADTGGDGIIGNSAHPRRNLLHALVVALRPKQWTKNLLLFAALLFTLDAKHTPADVLRSLLAFAVFCLLSGATYLVNDILDVELDRAHPRKCRRPIACGELGVRPAGLIAAVLFVIGLTAAFRLNLHFGAASVLYVVLTLAYSLKLKHVVILDLLTLASGFLLRAVAGGWAIDVRISQWLVLCTMLLALFLGIAKRRGELMAVLGGRKVGRGVISEYSAPLLDQMTAIVTSALLMSYALYTIQSVAAARHPYLLASFPFVLYGVFRYLYLIHVKQQGEEPDEAMLRDKPLLASVALWALVTAVLITQRL